MAIQAVLTGDIVNSTQLSPAAGKKLLTQLHQVLGAHQYEFYRGDSFQVYLRDAAPALQLALLCRTAAMGIAGVAGPPASDVRLSIGIAATKPPAALLGASKGEAFIVSGRAFDEMLQQGSRLAITSINALANEGLDVIAAYINAIFKMMTGKQAMVIFELLKGDTQQAVAQKLKKSKSTVHQHVTAGRWPEIEKLLQQYTNIVKLIV